MKAYVIKTDKRIYPLMDKASEVLVANRRLSESQATEIKRAGLVPVLVEKLEDINDEMPHLLLYDNLCISAQALILVLKAAKKTDKSFQCAVEGGYYSRTYLWGLEQNSQGAVPLELYYKKNSKDSSDVINVVHFECRKFERERMPPHMEVEGRGFDHPLTDILLIPINNWINLWQANVGMLMKHAYELEFTKRYRQIIPIIRALGSIDKAPMYFNKIGKNCYIHPSAVVEASVIGDNVHIGANAVVRLCNIDDGAYISDQALLRVNCIGKGAYIANNNNVAFCTVNPRSFLISGPYQFSLFGQDCAVMHCIDCDCRLDSYTIRARIQENQTVDTKQLYLGSCYGHRTRIGAGTISAPGSAVPNDIWINPNPQMVMKNFEGLPTSKNLFLSENGVVSKEQLPVLR